MSVSERTRHRLAVQGYRDLTADTLVAVAPWVRFSPALCATVMAVGTVLASPVVLWSLAAIAALGAVFPRHPFDLLYNYGLRHWAGTPALPRNGAPRRFACGVATVWLTATGLAFSAGMLAVGYTLGVLITATATLVSTTDICIPSMVYRALFQPLERSA